MTEQLLTYHPDGNPSAILPIETIHKENLLHKAVHILIVNSKGQIFVRQRPQTKKVYPGMLTSSVGAHVLPNEAADAAAVNNLKNFLGLSVPLKQLGEAQISDEYENEHVSVWVGYAETIPDLNKDQSGQSSQFMSIKEIQGLAKEKVTPHLLEAIRLFKELQSANH